jgi:hypothetical protein
MVFVSVAVVLFVEEPEVEEHAGRMAVIEAAARMAMVLMFLSMMEVLLALAACRVV